MGLGAQRGTVAMTRSESSRKGRGTVWRSLLGAPPLLVVELTEAEPNSSSTGTTGAALTETAGEGGTQSCEGGTQSMSTATDQLSSSPSTMETIEGVGHPEIGGGDGMCRESTVGGRFGEGLLARQMRGACGVLRRESMRPSDAVESLSLPELLAEYWESSWSSAGSSTCKETIGEEELLIVSLSMMLLASVESWSRRGMRWARLARSLSTSRLFSLSQSSQSAARIWLSSPRILMHASRAGFSR